MSLANSGVDFIVIIVRLDEHMLLSCTLSSLDNAAGVLPKYFSSEWSFAQFHVQEVTQFFAAFGAQNTIAIIGMDGR